MLLVDLSVSLESVFEMKHPNGAESPSHKVVMKHGKQEDQGSDRPRTRWGTPGARPEQRRPLA